MSRISRIFQLLQTFRRLQPPVTAGALANAMGVSERTVYRDVETLRGLGAVIDGTAGYGYALSEDPALPPMMFGDEEIEALVLGLREVREIGDKTLADAAETALRKLQARLPDAQSTRLKHAVLSAKRFLNLPEIKIDTRELRRLTWAERVLSISYQNAEGVKTKRQIYPLGIVFFDQSRVLLAWCCLRQSYRSFRLDRISSFSETGVSFRPRRVSMLREFLKDISEDQPESQPGEEGN